MSRVGVTSTSYNSIAIRNPVTANDYHIYHVEHIELNDKATFDYVTPATALGIPAPQRWRREFEVDLHDVQAIYPSYSSGAPEINDVYLTVYTDQSYTNQGYNDNFQLLTTSEFVDVQDD